MEMYSCDWTVETIINLFIKGNIKHIVKCDAFYSEQKLVEQLRENFAPHMIVLNEFRKEHYYEIIAGGNIINVLNLLHSKNKLTDEMLNIPIRTLIGLNEDSGKMRSLM